MSILKENKYIVIANEIISNENGVIQYKTVVINAGVSELNYTELIFDLPTNWQNWKVVTTGAYDLLSKMKNSEEEE